MKHNKKAAYMRPVTQIAKTDMALSLLGSSQGQGGGGDEEDLARERRGGIFSKSETENDGSTPVVGGKLW